MPQNALWTAIWLGLVFSLLVLGILETFDVARGSQPSDQELGTNYLAHEAAFDDLVRKLAREYPGHGARRGDTSDPATVVELSAATTRFGAYGPLLQRISVANLRYFPDSGKLILVPDGEQDPQRPSKSYVYSPHAQLQALGEHRTYSWRGPGVGIVTGDSPLRAGWFIHHDTTVEVAVTPY